MIFAKKFNPFNLPFDKIKNIMDLMSFPERVKFEISKGDLMAFAEYLINNNDSSKKELEAEEFIYLKDVSDLSGLAKQTIYGRVSKGTIPYYKTEDGKKLRFKKSEILEWMSSGKRNTEADIQKGVDAYFNKTKKLSQKNR
jgi:excisionase family DNA binding protein